MNPRLAYPIALATGVLLSFAFPRPSLSFLAWVALAPALALTSGSGPWRGAGVWALFGLGFFGSLLSWVSIAGWISWALVLVVEVPFIALFGALWGWLSKNAGSAGRIAAAAGTWAAIEFLRSVVPLGGFTWGQLAQSQHDVVWMLEWAALGGGIVLAGVLVAVNAALVEVFRARRAVRSVIGPALVMVLAFAIPAVNSMYYASADVTPIRIALVQGSVDPDVPLSYDKDVRILDRHVRLTQDLDEKVDVVVWPESSIGIDPDLPEVADALTRAASAVDAPMIVGGNEDVDQDRYRVSAFFVDRTGVITDRYRKTHLVPFGEYVPFRSLIGSLPILQQVPRDAVPGDEGKLFRVGDIDVAPVISFEGDFGSLVRGRIADGGDVLVVATNTSTWLHSWASAQHVAFSQVRAAENATPVVHAAISGVSAFISDRGELLDSLPLYEQGSMIRAVAPRVTTTPYTRFGESILLGFVIACGAVWGISRRGRKEGLASPDA